MADASEEDWLYHLPEFLDQVRDRGAHDVVGHLDAAVDGVLYHHRGARVPAYNATFGWRNGTFDLELDAVGPRSAWAVFDADRDWDFYLSQASGDAPCLAWMTDAEFDAEEAAAFEHKRDAVGMGRFSFGLYLQSPPAWEDVAERANETTAPCFVHRPSGRTLVPEGGLEQYSDVLPPEVFPDGDDPPAHLGLVETHVSSDP